MSSAERVRPPSTRSAVSGLAEVRGDGVGERDDLRGDALAQGADQVARGGVEAEAGQRAAQVAAPPGRGEAGERGDEGDARRCRATAAPTGSRSSAPEITPRSVSQRTADAAV